jgi:mannose-6-phosphate isomerase
MANSDNVVRAGLTPKLRDSHTLIEMLTYAVRDPAALKGENVAPGVTLYVPPVPDFQLQVCVAKGELAVPKHASASVGIVTEGSGVINGVAAGPGSSIFVPCGVPLAVHGNLTLFLASASRTLFV